MGLRLRESCFLIPFGHRMQVHAVLARPNSALYITPILPNKSWVPILNASYSASNITELFFLKAMNNLTGAGVNYTEVGVRYAAVSANSRSGKRLETEAPDVETYCLYSGGVDTAKT